MNDKRAKQLRRMAFAEAAANPPLVPRTLQWVSNGRERQPSLRNHPHSVRGIYRRMKREDRHV